MTGAPVPAVYRDVILGPLERGTNKLRLVFRTFPGGLAFPHTQIVRDALIDITQVGELDAADRAEPKHVAGPVLYAGVCFQHFGHFIAECLHRLYALDTDPALRHARIVYHMFPGMTQMPAWALRILELQGIDPARLILLDRPMRFEALHVPPMGRILGGETLIEGYGDLFPRRRVTPDPGTAFSKHLYLSRGDNLVTGGFIGEELVEARLAAAGVEIVVPERTDIAVLIQKIVASETITLCEGSALHNVDLCGRINAGILMVARRGGIAQRFHKVLSNATDRWRIFEGYQDAGVLEWDPARGGPHHGRSISHLDFAGFFRAYADFTGLDIAPPDPETVERVTLLALARYMLDPRVTSVKATSDAQLGALLRRMRTLNLMPGTEKRPVLKTRYHPDPTA